MSDEPIDLNAERQKRLDKPGAEHVCQVVEDGKMVTYYEFTCSYTLPDGGEFCFEIWAKDPEDAERHMACLRATARVDGQVFESFGA